MELKPNALNAANEAQTLLIVPYGIETHVSQLPITHLEVLLIVPYGIETTFTLIKHNVDYLLIVPYGIETIIGYDKEYVNNIF